MPRILVLYGTTDGHTAKVARAFREQLALRGHQVDLVDAAAGAPDATGYDAVAVAASVHASGYQRDVIQWVSANLGVLNRVPTIFLSVCLGVLQHDPKVDRDLQDIIASFQRATGWLPSDTRMIAGALLYTQYGFVKRLMMRGIARKAGGDTDTSRDYEYTDWEELRRIADTFGAQLNGGRLSQSA